MVIGSLTTQLSRGRLTEWPPHYGNYGNSAPNCSHLLSRVPIFLQGVPLFRWVEKRSEKTKNGTPATDDTHRRIYANETRNGTRTTHGGGLRKNIELLLSIRLAVDS
uniref:(northern house mosquito) hypothetical protein n=1 Tax=Culex pipiens TaxID=7175 RepID=A0A8D8GWP4_CULPI